MSLTLTLTLRLSIVCCVPMTYHVCHNHNNYKSLSLTTFNKEFIN